MTDTPTHAPLPCPFCGGEAKTISPLGFGNVRAIECCNSDDCAATGPWACNEAEALAAWNQRAGSGEVAWRGMDSAPVEQVIIAAWKCDKTGVYQVSGDVTNAYGNWISESDGLIYPIAWQPLPPPPGTASPASTDQVLVDALREALEVARNLIESIEQTPANVWHVATDDPEATCSEAYQAVCAILTKEAGHG